jgi:hypothetical protein
LLSEDRQPEAAVDNAALPAAPSGDGAHPNLRTERPATTHRSDGDGKDPGAVKPHVDRTRACLLTGTQRERAAWTHQGRGVAPESVRQGCWVPNSNPSAAETLAEGTATDARIDTRLEPIGAITRENRVRAVGRIVASTSEWRTRVHDPLNRMVLP